MCIYLCIYIKLKWPILYHPDYVSMERYPAVERCLIVNAPSSTELIHIYIYIYQGGKGKSAYFFIYWRLIALSTAQGFPQVQIWHKWLKRKGGVEKKWWDRRKKTGVRGREGGGAVVVGGGGTGKGDNAKHLANEQRQEWVRIRRSTHSTISQEHHAHACIIQNNFTKNTSHETLYRGFISPNTQLHT